MPSIGSDRPNPSGPRENRDPNTHFAFVTKRDEEYSLQVNRASISSDPALVDVAFRYLAGKSDHFSLLPHTMRLNSAVAQISSRTLAISDKQKNILLSAMRSIEALVLSETNPFIDLPQDTGDQDKLALKRIVNRLYKIALCDPALNCENLDQLNLKDSVESRDLVRTDPVLYARFLVSARLSQAKKQGDGFPQEVTRLVAWDLTHDIELIDINRRAIALSLVADDNFTGFRLDPFIKAVLEPGFDEVMESYAAKSKKKIENKVIENAIEMAIEQATTKEQLEAIAKYHELVGVSASSKKGFASILTRKIGPEQVWMLRAAGEAFFSNPRPKDTAIENRAVGILSKPDSLKSAWSWLADQVKSFIQPSYKQVMTERKAAALLILHGSLSPKARLLLEAAARSKNPTIKDAAQRALTPRTPNLA